MCLQTQLQSKLPLSGRSRQGNTSLTPSFTGTLLSRRVENVTLQPIFKMGRASYTSIGDTFTVFRRGMHVGAKTIKHCLCSHLCQSWNGQRQQRIEDKAILLGIDAINGLDHPLIQFFLKSSFL